MQETIYRDNTKKEKAQIVQLHRAEAKLIMAIRTIGFGEIEGLKIKDRLPISYRSAKKTCKF